MPRLPQLTTDATIGTPTRPRAQPVCRAHARLREQLALLVANDNACTYCVSAHTLRGRRIGLTDDDLARTRRADDTDPHAAAVLHTAREILAHRGDLDDGTLAEVRAAGVTDVELADGYLINTADGRPTQVLDAARVAIEGGFVHIDAPGSSTVQVVSAPAVKRLAYAPNR